MSCDFHEWDIGMLEGSYANYIKILHKDFEFVLDFDQYYPENKEAELSIWVVTSPFKARAFLTILKESIATYERAYGAVDKDEAL